MNTCNGEDLSRYLDGELSPAAARRVADHLATCPGCREEYAMLTRLNALTEEVFPRMRFHRPFLTARPYRPLRWLAAAAAVLLVSGGLTWAAYRWYHDKPKTPVVVTQTDAPRETVPPSEAEATPEQEAKGPSMPGPVVRETEPAATPPSHSTRFLTGTVSDCEGKALDKARIVLATWDAEGVARTTGSVAYTDAAGAFTIAYPENPTQLLVHKVGYEPLEATCRDVIRGAEVSVHATLIAVEEVTGTVVDEQGRPVAGAVVHGVWDADDTVGPKARTDTAGRFRIQAEPHANWAEHPNFAPASGNVDADGTTVTVRLGRPGSIVADVLRAGTPVAGARVELQTEGGALLSRSGKTDPAGRVRFDGLPARDYQVLARTPSADFAACLVTVRAGETAPCTLPLTDDYAGTLRGRIVDDQGMPLPGARLVLTRRNDPMTAHSVPVNKDGDFEVGLELGDTQARVVPPQSGLWECVGEPQRAFTVNAPREHFHAEFMFRAVQPFMVAMVDRDDRPVTKAYVSAGNCLRDWWGQVQFLVSTPTGGFELHAQDFEYGWAYDPETGLGGSVGPYRPGSTRTLTVRLTRPTGMLDGRVQEPDGTPVAGASVYARLEDMKDLLAAASTQSRASGLFTLGPLDLNGEYSVFALRRGYQMAQGTREDRVRPGSQRDPLLIVLERTNAELGGTVVYADGVPVPGAYIAVERNGERCGGSIRTDEAGTFRVWVSRGEYVVQAVADSEGPLGHPVATPWATVNAPARDLLLMLPVSAPAEELGEVVPPEGPEHEQAQEAFTQMGLVFKMFANEAERGLYPPLNDAFGVFSPNPADIYPEYLADSVLLARVTGKQDVKSCYLGYAVNSEVTGLAFLNAYEEYGPEGLAGQDIQVEQGAGAGGGEMVYRLREGIERFFITDINDPNAGSRAQSQIPILWEMPGDRDESGGWVLYMDGHVDWEPYPGKFPMSEAFVTRLRELMTTQ